MTLITSVEMLRVASVAVRYVNGLSICFFAVGKDQRRTPTEMPYGELNPLILTGTLQTYSDLPL